MESEKNLMRISRRLRKTMLGKNMIYPDSREGLTPYSLMCIDCGNYKYFNYEKTVKARIAFTDNGKMIFKFLESADMQLSKKERVALLIDKHFAAGTVSYDKIKKYRVKVTCANCGSDNISLYGDVLQECYQNRCVGCFKCGGAFNRDNIKKYCVQCVSLRRDLADNPALFWLTLDMDLFCDACPIVELREDLGITGEEIKKEVCGRL